MFLSWLKSLRLRPVDQRYALLEACLIGIISAVAALTLKQGIGWVGSYRVYAANEIGWFILPLAGFVFGGLAGFLLQWGSPEAKGGGITQVKMVLAQYPGALSLRSAVVKLLGTIVILGAGFTLGRRGPTVNIGAALAAQLSMWLPSSPQHRRQMIAAGAASGLAAGFNTPIAGILFVIEELMRDISGFTLETAILASFTGAVVSQLIESPEPRLPNIVAEGDIAFNPEEIPFFLILGFAAGLLGVLFNQGVLSSINLYEKFLGSLPLRIAVAGFLSGSIVATLPDFFRNNAGLRDFLITGESGWQVTALVLVAYFCLTIIASGSGAPGGLFSPGLVLGSALGYLIGVAKVALMGFGSETTYALAGMGAVFTAIVRVPVTAIVIIFELTASFELVLPLMITCATAYIVGESISSGSLYQKLLANQGIDLQDEAKVNPIFAQKTAAEVMTFPVESVSPDLTLEETYKLFSSSAHHAFPVTEQGKLLGIITEGELGKFIGSSQSLVLRDMMTPQPISVPPDASLQYVLALLNRYQISHLPVTKRRRLVGIITRHDLIRAEVEELNQSNNPHPELENPVRGEPSYLIYQTRSPALGQGRILLPIANPNTTVHLTEIASAIAHSRQAELEISYLIKVPRHTPPNQTWVNPTPGRRLLQQAEAIAIEQDIPVHTQLRTTHDRSETLFELLKERKISLLVMGWKGPNHLFNDRLFGSITEKMMRQALCDVVLVKPATQPLPKQRLSASQRWLIPFPIDHPKAPQLLKLLPQLTPVEQETNYILCPSDGNGDLCQHEWRILEETAQQLQQQLKRSVEVISHVQTDNKNPVLQLAHEQQCDVIVLVGTVPQSTFSLEYNFQKNRLGIIAKRFRGTVILFRPC